MTTPAEPSAAALRHSAGVGPTPAPAGAREPVELRMAGAALKVLAVLAPPTLLCAWLLAGPDGLRGAALGAGVVAGMYLLSAGLLTLAARAGDAALMGAALGGFVLRLMLYGLMVTLLRDVEAIDGPSLAVSAAVLLVATLLWEVRVACRTPGLFWVTAAPRTAGDAPTPLERT